MSKYILDITFSDELYHHGILGQKWGIRRYQNKDGSLTEAGKKRLSKYTDIGQKNNIFEKTTNRDFARKEYSKNIDDQIIKIGKNVDDAHKIDGYELAQLLGERNLANIWNKFIDKYAEATLTDLGFVNSE